MDEKYDYPGEHYETQNIAWVHPCYYRASHLGKDRVCLLLSIHVLSGIPCGIPQVEEPGGLQSERSQKVRHNWVTKYTSVMCIASQVTRGKESSCQHRKHKRPRFDPWVRKIPWSMKWQPRQYSCLENPMDRGASGATVHGVAKSGSWWSMHALYYITCIAGAHLPITSLGIPPEILLRACSVHMFSRAKIPEN